MRSFGAVRSVYVVSFAGKRVEVYGPPLFSARFTTYPVAPGTARQFKTICPASLRCAVRCAGTPSASAGRIAHWRGGAPRTRAGEGTAGANPDDPPPMTRD